MLLTVKQLAERLSLSTSRVYSRINQGKLSHHRIGNERGAIRVSEDDLNRFLAATHQLASDDDCRKPAARPKLKHVHL